MPRLRDRNHQIPGGYQFIQPQLNWQLSGGDYKSFATCTQEIVQVRKANAHLSQQAGLSTDEEVVADELDDYNAQRMLQRGWSHFLGDASPSRFSFRLNPRQFGAVAAAAGAVKRTAAGVALVAEWLGSGLRPVDSGLAHKRAAVCVDCPQNQDPGWLGKLTEAAAADVKKLMEIRNELSLSTPHDDRLHECKACGCALKLKPWAPLKHILNHLDDATRAKLDQRCWVLSEEKANAPTAR